MGYAFPNARKAVRELCRPYGTTFLHLPEGWEKQVPAILVYRSGGTEDGPFREERIVLEVYAVGSTAATDLAETIHEFLTGAPHYVEGVGLIDDVIPLVVPSEVPYESDTLNLVTASYRVATRGL